MLKKLDIVWTLATKKRSLVYSILINESTCITVCYNMMAYIYYLLEFDYPRWLFLL